MKLYIHFFIALLLMPYYLNAQTLNELENNFVNLTNSYNFEASKLDSLQKVLEYRAKQIDNEKQKNNKDKVINLMANSVTLSNKVESQQKKVQNITKDIESVKKRLYGKYSVIIDSLKTSQADGSFKGSKKDIDDRILDYTERRLLVSPKINSLSFNPSKLLEININSIKDPSEKNIYREYLSSALSEINNQISSVDKSYDEVRQIIYLQKKAGRFLEEAEFENELGHLHRSNSTANNAGESSINYGGPRSSNDGIGIVGEAKNSLSVQIASYSFLLNQLDYGKTSRWNNSSQNNKKNLSLKEYQAMLKELKGRLVDYKSVLLNKMDKI